MVWFTVFQWCKGDMHPVESTLWILNCDLFPGYRYAVQCSLMMLGREPKLPLSHTITRVQSQYTYNYTVPIQLSGFSLLVQYSISYIRYLTLIRVPGGLSQLSVWLNFSSGHDLMVNEIESLGRLHADSVELAWDSLFPSPSAPTPLVHCSLSQNK